MSYYTCPKCQHGFDEKPSDGYCWACKDPIVDEADKPDFTFDDMVKLQRAQAAAGWIVRRRPDGAIVWAGDDPHAAVDPKDPA